MTDLQRLELRMGDLRKQLAEAIAATEPDTEAIEKLTGEIRAADAQLVIYIGTLAPSNGGWWHDLIAGTNRPGTRHYLRGTPESSLIRAVPRHGVSLAEGHLRHTMRRFCRRGWSYIGHR